MGQPTPGLRPGQHSDARLLERLRGGRAEIPWCDISPAYRVLTTLATAWNGRAPQVATVPAHGVVGVHKVMGTVVSVARIASLPFTVIAGGSDEEEPPATGPSSFADTALHIRPASSAKHQADAWWKFWAVRRAPPTGRELSTPSRHVGRRCFGKQPRAGHCPTGSVRTG